MKLLRLAPTDSQAQFDNTFPDIVIKPNSSIALKNLSFETVKPSITITAANETIEFTVRGEPHARNIRLDHETYTQANHTELINDIQHKLNQALVLEASEIGVQWQTKVDSTNKVNVGFKAAPYSFIPDNWKVGGDFSAAANGTLTQTSGTSATDMTNRMYSETPFIKGCGVMRFNLAIFADNGTANNGFIVGLSKVRPARWDTATITDEMMDYNISVSRTADNGGFYSYRVGGATTTSTTAPQTNDYVEINISAGSIRGVIYGPPAGGVRPAVQLFSETYNGTTNYYPFVVIKGTAAETRLANFRFQHDPHLAALNPSYQSDGDFGAMPTPSATRVTTNQLNFESIALSSFLGYNEPTNSQTAVTANFVADLAFELAILNDNFIVELQNLTIEAFDGFESKGRRSILEFVPVSDDVTQRLVQYEPNTLNFVDIKNREAMTIRNLKARVWRTDYQPVHTQGISVITLLIDGS